MKTLPPDPSTPNPVTSDPPRETSKTSEPAEAAEAAKPSEHSGGEQELVELRERFAALQSRLDESQQTITALERRQKIDALLAASDAIDPDAARLLTEITVAQMDEPDVAAAVEDLRRHKPYLFRHRQASPGSAMSPRLESPAAHEHAADHAAATGDRRDLMDYLRLRRSR